MFCFLNCPHCLSSLFFIYGTSFNISFSDSAIQIIPFLEISLLRRKVTLDFDLRLTSPLSQDLIMNGFLLKTDNLSYIPAGPPLCNILYSSSNNCHRIKLPTKNVRKANILFFSVDQGCCFSLHWFSEQLQKRNHL